MVVLCLTGGLYLPCLHHSDHALGHAVGAFGVIFLGEAGAEECGERLVEAGAYGSEKRLYELV